MSLKSFQATKLADFGFNEFSSSKANDGALHSIKQSAYFHQDKKKVADPLEVRLQATNERIQQHEEHIEKRFEHLEERVKQVNQKFERIEQLGDRLESLNKLIDTLKTNFDAKLMVFDDKLSVASQRFEKKLSHMKVEMADRVRSEQSSQEGSRNNELTNDMQQMFQMLKKTQSAQRDLQLEVSTMKMNGHVMTKERDIRQSEVLQYSTKENHRAANKKDQENYPLKQSGVLYQQQPNHQSSQQKPDSHQHYNHQQQQQTQHHTNQANSLQISSPSNHSRVESFKQQHFGAPTTTTTINNNTKNNDRVRSITLEKEKFILQQDLEQRHNKKDKISSQYLNTEEDEHEKKSRSRSKKVSVMTSERNNNQIVDKYQFTLQSKVLSVVDPNIVQRSTQFEAKSTINQSDNQQLCNKSKSQQGQLRMTFNFKDELQLPRDRIASKGQQSTTQQQAAKIMPPEQNKQNLLERAISQDNLYHPSYITLYSRSKYLSSDKVGRVYRVEEDQENMMKK